VEMMPQLRVKVDMMRLGVGCGAMDVVVEDVARAVMLYRRALLDGHHIGE
jgi:hypothetical protein